MRFKRLYIFLSRKTYKKVILDSGYNIFLLNILQLLNFILYHINQKVVFKFMSKFVNFRKKTKGLDKMHSYYPNFLKEIVKTKFIFFVFLGINLRSIITLQGGPQKQRFFL